MRHRSPPARRRPRDNSIHACLLLAATTRPRIRPGFRSRRLFFSLSLSLVFSDGQRILFSSARRRRVPLERVNRRSRPNIRHFPPSAPRDNVNIVLPLHLHREPSSPHAAAPPPEGFRKHDPAAPARARQNDDNNSEKDRKLKRNRCASEKQCPRLWDPDITFEETLCSFPLRLLCSTDTSLPPDYLRPTYDVYPRSTTS